MKDLELIFRGNKIKDDHPHLTSKPEPNISTLMNQKLPKSLKGLSQEMIYKPI